MIRLAFADLRDSWPSWLGVSLSFIITNAAIALSVLVIVVGADGAQRNLGEEVEGFGALGGMNLIVCALVALAVVSSSTALVVSSRRATLARYLLAGAGPTQMTRMLLLQLAVTSLACALLGDLLAIALIQPALDYAAADQGITPPAAIYSVEWILFSNLFCAVLAMVGGLRQARAANRIPPVEALRDATAQAPDRQSTARTVLRAVRAVLIIGVLIALYPALKSFLPEFEDDALAMVANAAILTVPLTGLAFATVAPWIVRPLVRAWTAIIPVPGPSWHLARHTVIAKADRLVKSVIPVMFTVGLLFGMMALTSTLIAAFEEVTGEAISGVSVASMVLTMGLPLAIATAGSVGNLVMMSRQRAAELALDSVVGATPAQQVLIPVLEAVIVTVTASLMGVAMAVAGGALLAYGLGVLALPGSLVMPWGVLAALAALSTAIAVAATVLPILPSLRQPAPKVIARLVAS